MGSGSRRVATFEVLPRLAEDCLRRPSLGDVAYLQSPTVLSWGYALRLSPTATLPSRGDPDSFELVFEFIAGDGAEPSGFVVAQTLECEHAVDR